VALQGITEKQRLHIREELIEIGTECILKNPITIEDVRSFRNKQFPNGANAGCFIACVFNKAGIFNDEGLVSKKTATEKATKVFDDETELKNYEQFIAVCDKVNEESVSDGQKGCERAKLAFQCLIQNSKQVFIPYNLLLGSR
ncbi:general odorant-binding protein 99a, partial [Manduca sexta]|uniref:general odorant-binding protein 99a n=1 Tax=Manduca sexta TaxID=7130 RepID=UPI00188F4BD2